MKSLLFSRFLLLLPWVLIVIIVLDIDSSRAPLPAPSPRGGAEGGSGGARSPPRRRPEPALPTIYAITPTYSRPVQKAELTRLANTFRQVSRLHWILVEDAAARSELVTRFVAGAGLPCTHLHVPTPRRYKRPGLPRATEQRNAGLAWLRQRHQHLPPPQPGVLFFADDDNTYSLELFQEVRAGRGDALGRRSPSLLPAPLGLCRPPSRAPPAPHPGRAVPHPRPAAPAVPYPKTPGTGEPRPVPARRPCSARPSRRGCPCVATARLIVSFLSLLSILPQLFTAVFSLCCRARQA